MTFMTVLTSDTLVQRSLWRMRVGFWHACSSVYHEQEARNYRLRQQGGHMQRPMTIALFPTCASLTKNSR